MRIAHVHNFNTSSSDPKKTVKSATIEVDIKPIRYLEDLGLFDDEKEFYRFIVRTKYYIRKSGSYTEFIKFLKKKRGMNRCGVHVNLWGDDGYQIHMHHTPLVLEDIIHVVIAKRQEEMETLTMSAIAREVRELHYLGLVGLYPLCETCHEYAHGDTNDLFIPEDAIYGDVDAFFDIYDKYIADSLKQKYHTWKTLNEGYSIIKSEIPESLMRKYIYVKTKGDQQVMSNAALVGFINELSK